MNNVLNLSAFGEVIPKRKDQEDITFNSFMKSDETPNKETENEKVSDLVAHKVLMHASQIKLFHWQTMSYAEHKALDKAFENMVDLGDELVETVMGKYGRPTLSGNGRVNLSDYSDSKSCLEQIVAMKECYCEEIRSMFSPEKDSEILNIVDEIVAMFDKTMYLLSLK